MKNIVFSFQKKYFKKIWTKTQKFSYVRSIGNRKDQKYCKLVERNFHGNSPTQRNDSKLQAVSQM